MEISGLPTALSQLPPASLVGGTIALGVLVLFVSFSLNTSAFPVINARRPFEIRSSHAKRRFLSDARNLIASGLRQSSVFWIVSEDGRKLVLSPKYATEIRGHAELSVAHSINEDFHTHIRGFEPFLEGTFSDGILQNTVRMKLNQCLADVIKPLSDETEVALQSTWADSQGWHNLVLRRSMLDLVAQISSRVFLGDSVCRDPAWRRISINYTVDSFIAARALRLWPKLVRSTVANFLPSCRKIRRHLQQAGEIIHPMLDERRARHRQAIDQGKTPERYVDALQWMEDCAQGRPYDPTAVQVSLSVGAIHTTSDMLTQVLLDLCRMPDVVHALREEIVAVFPEDGWTKRFLHRLKLMDSVLKESQRLKPTNISSMRRLALQDVTLSDGQVIPRGASMIVSNARMWDSAVYADPGTFDPYRFLKLREVPGHETSAQSVSPSPEHMGFGFGKYACPGRFFAITEVKVALCHILMKYDLKLADGCTPTTRKMGLALLSDPVARIAVRRRREELSLSTGRECN